MMDNGVGNEQWIELRDRRGKLQARYDVRRRVLEIRTKGSTQRYPLAEIERGLEKREQVCDNSG